MPTLLFGTAKFAFTIDRPTAFALLDAFYAAGFREVDTATNYPIDKNPDHFRKAEEILTEWIDAHGVKDLKITAKVGSIDNMRSPLHLLNRSFLLMCLDEYRRIWDSNLDTYMVHWDNREDIDEIRETLQALAYAAGLGLRPGLSGIARPDLYAEANRDFGLDFRIQLKHNVLESKYGHYKPFHGAKRFVAYGINAGGIKLGQDPRLDFLKPVLKKAASDKNRPPVEHFYQVGMLFAYFHPEMEGILIGPSSKKQLQENLAFFQDLNKWDYPKVYALLRDDNFLPQRR